MPPVHASLTLEERQPDRSTALTVKLWMPSELSKSDDDVPTATRSMAIRLDWACMDDELENLMHQLKLRGCLNRFKIRNIKGQRANSARTAQDAVDANVQEAASAYRRHRSAYFALVGPGNEEGGWEHTMRVLADSDCRGLGDRLIEQMEYMSVDKARNFVASRRDKSASSGETLYKLPWIWYRKGGSQNGDKLSDGASICCCAIGREN